MKISEGGKTMSAVVKKKESKFLRELSTVSSFISSHNTVFKNFSIIVGNKEIPIPHKYIVKEISDYVDVEVKNAYWNSGFIKTVMNIIGRYYVDTFKNNDGITVNRISTDDICIAVVDYILYDESCLGYSNMHYLYIIRSEKQKQ